ncbi:hypothetical protein CMQ_549 [Grosmannia clavigera kw1407]|uniref:Uncharacterized protein n=1 Tax=Grosmannia clavigera (strain kw1407 / UAMH 11150) TaxID=655863 RepID=F0XCQ2_GROCL|nr:uncharacterized protein CMQ_549 [Grosmannia clavigera kw1407]EFX03621.1 hypothetical protein CMQ_549 [Grosmannia clavigera kw1407]
MANQTSASATTANAPSTPVKVPSAAASYTPATLDPDLRSQINMVLIRDGHVSKIQDHLLHILHADSSNWPAAIQAHALQLLRSGDYTNFPALMRRVMDDIRRDTLATPNGDGTADKKGSSPAASLALPKTVVDEALRVTRESLEMVCEIEENGSL